MKTKTERKKRHALVISLVAGLVLLLAGPARSEVGFSFTKIADNSTTIPGWVGAANKFKEFGTPAVDGNYVAFAGKGWIDEIQGIYIHDGTGVRIHIRPQHLHAQTRGLELPHLGLW